MNRIITKKRKHLLNKFNTKKYKNSKYLKYKKYFKLKKKYKKCSKIKKKKLNKNKSKKIVQKGGDATLSAITDSGQLLLAGMNAAQLFNNLTLAGSIPPCISAGGCAGNPAAPTPDPVPNLTSNLYCRSIRSAAAAGAAAASVGLGGYALGKAGLLPPSSIIENADLDTAGDALSS